MTDRDVLELLSMFTTAAQIAKSRNKVDYKLKIDEATLVQLFKKAFPSLKNEVTVAKIVKDIMANQ